MLFRSESFELTPTDAASMSVAELLVQSESNDFFDAVKADSALMIAVLDNIFEVIYDSSASQLSVQEASILGAGVFIYTSPAGDLLANTAKLADPNAPEIVTIKDLFDQILPDSVYNGALVDEIAFKEMVAAIENANTFYAVLGYGLDGDYLTSTVSAGEIAIGAYMGAVLESFNPVPILYEDVGDYLYAVLNDEALPPNFTAPDTTTEGYYLTNIINAEIGRASCRERV